MSWAVSFLVRPSCSVEVKRCVLPLCLPGRSQTLSPDCSVGMKILEVHKLDMPWYMSSWAILGERGFVSEITPFLGSIVTQFYSIYLYMPIQELMAPKGKFPCKHFLANLSFQFSDLWRNYFICYFYKEITPLLCSLSIKNARERWLPFRNPDCSDYMVAIIFLSSW